MTDDIKRVLLIGSGPIIIGQSAEFDYSGNQAIKALISEGKEVLVVNSNPATIQTDNREGIKPFMIPLNKENILEIIKKERPDSIMGTFGGQTGLNLLMELWKSGIISKYGIKVLGTPVDAIEISEDRLLFKKKMEEIGEPVLESYYCTNLNDVIKYAKQMGFPVVVRPSFTLGGSGGGIANDIDELRSIAERGLNLSQVGGVLIEKSIIGWTELEVEVVRDGMGNKIAVCTMENVDPMGVHTGDSIVVTPFLTLNDENYQKIRSAALKIAEGIGVIGACNVQFAFDNNSGKYYVIEVNPRLSRSSALASKATGYPIARVAALIALGKTIEFIENRVTGEKNSAREPAIDYIVAKFPIWPTEKFFDADFTLGTQMKSTGEVMSIGKSLSEAFRKALRSTGLLTKKGEFNEKLLTVPNPERALQIYLAYKRGYDTAKISKLTGWNLLFVDEIIRAFEMEENEGEVFSVVDTCAGEFDVKTPYYYSSPNGSKIMANVLLVGSGPITIGQGIEFDYSCVHASKVIRELGKKVVILNDNPETVSTDFDESDVLIFDPVDYKSVATIINNSNIRTIVPWFGGQRPINILRKLKENFGDKIEIPGTSVEVVDLLEDREKFANLMNEMNIPYPEFIFSTKENLKESVERIGFPVIVRPSYTISGAHMGILRNTNELNDFVSYQGKYIDNFLVEKYLDNSLEAEIDGVSDGESVLIPGIIEHIEEAGIHSGDSTSIFPSTNIPAHVQETMKEYTVSICRKLKIIGPFNIQFAVKNDTVYIIEINPRSSRTFPFISKISGINLAEISAKIIMGNKLSKSSIKISKYGVKFPIFPFEKLTEADVVLGPEMKSTGEVIGVGDNIQEAIINGYLAAGFDIKREGVIVSIPRNRRNEFLGIIKMIYDSGKTIYSTEGTHNYLKGYGIPSIKIKKIFEGSPNGMDIIKQGNISAVINILNENYRSESDGKTLRRACYERKILYMSVRSQAKAFAEVLTYKNRGDNIKTTNDSV
ncbi:MAG: carbamoyl-phosphate synthase large subunit [Thermoplasmata archaeon]